MANVTNNPLSTPALLRTMFESATAAALERKDAQPLAPSGPVGDAALIAMDPEKAQFLKDLVMGSTALAADAGARSSEEAGPEAQGLFAKLADALVPPQRGAEIGKQFAREVDKQETLAFAKLDARQQASGAFLLTQTTIPTPTKQAELVSQYAKVFHKALGLGRAASADQSAAGSQAEAGAAHTAATQTVHVLAGSISNLHRDFLQGGTAQDKSTVIPSPADVISAIQQGESQSDGKSSSDPGTQLALKLGQLPAVKTLDLNGMDIDSAVEAVLFECGQDTEDEVRGFMQTMQVSMNKKQQLNALKQQYTNAQTKMGQQMQKEFDLLSASGKIGKGVTVDDYKQWRQVSWSTPAADPTSGAMTIGDPTTADPWPPVMPAYLTKDKAVSGTPAASATANANDLTVMYGLPQSLVTYLKTQIWPNLPKSIVAGSGDDTGKFNDWLSAIGLTPVSGIDDVRANAKLVADYLNKTLPDAVNKTQTAQFTSGNEFNTKASDLMNQIWEALNDVKTSADASALAHDGGIYPQQYAELPEAGNNGEGWKEETNDAYGAQSSKLDKIPALVDQLTTLLSGKNACYMTDATKSMILSFFAPMSQGDKLLETPPVTSGQFSALLSYFPPDTISALNDSFDQLKSTVTNTDTSAAGQAGHRLYPSDSDTYEAMPTPEQVTQWQTEIAQTVGQATGSGIGDDALATAFKANLTAILASGTPPLSSDEQQSFTALLNSYDAHAPADFLANLQDAMIAGKYQPGGSEYALTQALMAVPGSSTPAASAGGSTGAEAGGALNANAANLVTVKDGSANGVLGGVIGGVLDGALGGVSKATVPVKNAGAIDAGKWGALHGLPLGAQPPTKVPTGTTDPNIGTGGSIDPTQLAARMQALLVGDGSGVQETDWEKQLVKNGIITDPIALAKDRKQALADQKQQEQDNADASAGLGAQRAAKGCDKVGTLADLKNAADAVGTQIDAMSDMSQMQQMQLQIYMDRRSKFYETLSNVLKKISSTADEIVGNMK